MNNNIGEQIKFGKINAHIPKLFRAIKIPSKAENNVTIISLSTIDLKSNFSGAFGTIFNCVKIKTNNSTLITSFSMGHQNLL